jgi:hypothetical protein
LVELDEPDRQERPDRRYFSLNPFSLSTCPPTQPSYLPPDRYIFHIIRVKNTTVRYLRHRYHSRVFTFIIQNQLLVIGNFGLLIALPEIS